MLYWVIHTGVKERHTIGRRVADDAMINDQTGISLRKHKLEALNSSFQFYVV